VIALKRPDTLAVDGSSNGAGSHSLRFHKFVVNNTAVDNLRFHYFVVYNTVGIGTFYVQPANKACGSTRRDRVEVFYT
jgi:hypothetical protein